jgi:uncharacterized membrane protein YbhN (UPF0104 family)
MPLPLAKASLLLIVACCFNGAAFGLLLLAFEPLSGREFIVAAAGFNLAGAAGVAAVPVPSGLGVREAVLVWVLHYIVPVETALAAALVARLISLPLDLALGAAGAAWLTATRRRRDGTPRAVAEQRHHARAA